MCAPAPFQSPGIGLGSKVTLIPKSSATRCNINLDIHKWSPISIPSQGPTWYSHWNKKDRPWWTCTFPQQVLEKHAGWIVSLIFLITNLRKQLTLGDAITDFLVNNVWGLDTDEQKCHPVTTQILIAWRGKFASTNQKHYPDLGGDTSSVWNFCARSTDVFW